MLALNVPQGEAQVVKEYLLKYDLLDREYRLTREADRVLFPVLREFSAPWDFDVDFVDVELPEHDRGMSLREALQDELTSQEMDDLIASYDIVGNLAIIEIPDSLHAKETVIGEKVIAVNKSVTTVLKKLGGHEGEYRTQAMACIAGEDIRETEVVENGVHLKVNVAEAYYSVRMSTERKRIAELIQPGERVLCMFSGVAPYPVVFSRKSEAKEIVGIEINPTAHGLAQENVATNRCTNVHLLRGDVHTLIPKLVADEQVFDRITMPLPHTAAEFLDDALRVSKKGTVIHFYSFQHENELEKAVEILRAAFRRNKRELGQYSLVKAGQHAPRIFRVCVDGEVL